MTMKTARIEVRRRDDWQTVQFENVEKVTAAGAPSPDGLQLTLIGHREDAPNQVESGIVEVADRHESLVHNEVPEVSILC